MQFPKVTSGEAATNFAAAAIALRQLGWQEQRNQADAVTGLCSLPGSQGLVQSLLRR